MVVELQTKTASAVADHLRSSTAENGEDEAIMRLRSQLLDEVNRQIANPVKFQ